MLRSVAVLVLDELAVFEFGVLCEVFGMDRTDDGVPLLDFRVCGVEAGRPVSTTGGVQVVPEHGLDGLRGADLVAVPATSLREFPPTVAAWTSCAHGTPRRSWTRTSCSSTTATSSPARAPPRASTRRCTSCAASWAARSSTSSP